MSKSNNTTSIFTENSPMLHRALYQQSNNPVGTSSLGKKRQAILLIRGLIERVELSEDTVYTLGRYNPEEPDDNLINLSPYGAEDRGVSRKHAHMHMADGGLYITDLASTNGTFIGGKRITPNEAQLLHKGQEILLGRLTLQILFS